MKAYEGQTHCIKTAYLRGMTYSHLRGCTPGSAPGPTHGNGYGRTFPYFTFNIRTQTVCYKKCII